MRVVAVIAGIAVGYLLALGQPVWLVVLIIGQVFLCAWATSRLFVEPRAR